LSNGFAWASDPDRLQGICIFGSAAIRVFVQRWWASLAAPPALLEDILADLDHLRPDSPPSRAVRL
jgi:hypothetical protein